MEPLPGWRNRLIVECEWNMRYLIYELISVKIISWTLCVFVERILDLERKAESLQSDKMKAERQNSEAQTKLDVLSNYFKQKEIELQRSAKLFSHVWQQEYIYRL